MAYPAPTVSTSSNTEYQWFYPTPTPSQERWSDRNQDISHAVTIQLLMNELLSKKSAILEHIKPKEVNVFGGSRCHLCNAPMKERNQRAHTVYNKKNLVKRDFLENEIIYRCGTKVVSVAKKNEEPRFRTTLGNDCAIPPSRQLGTGS